MNLKYNKRACILAAVAVIICVSSLIVLALKSDKYVYINELQRPQDNEGARKYDIELVVDESVDNVTVYVEAKKKTITEYAKKRISEEKEKRIVIAILDVDHFKSVNDTFGHLYGDKVLARVGGRLKEIVGEDGVIGRIGGDEFMIVFNGLDDDQVLRGMLRAIRTQIKWEFAEDFENLSITCSIGASIFPVNGRDYEDLFKKADCCLYIAKEKGRDRYVFFRDEMHRASGRKGKMELGTYQCGCQSVRTGERTNRADRRQL